MMANPFLLVPVLALGLAPLAQAETMTRADMRAYLAGEIARCWNIRALSEAAQGTAVTLSVSVAPDGRIVPGSVTFLSATTDVQATIDEAYHSARRAVLRCGGEPFDLPSARHDDWRDLELTFDPRPFLS
jgi:hypothetical protein